jgi:hypothetical protein
MGICQMKNAMIRFTMMSGWGVSVQTGMIFFDFASSIRRTTESR